MDIQIESPEHPADAPEKPGGVREKAAGAPEKAGDASEKVARADAVRNRRRVLDAAREALADEGLDAHMPDIARRAGVGIGTVYRHFPTKAALVAALADDHFARLVTLGHEELEAGGDAWEAFERFMWRSARQAAEDRGLAEIVANEPEAMAAPSPAKERLYDIGSEFVERAKHSGQMRADASVNDIPTIMCGLCQVAAAERDGRPGMSWERYLGLMLDGLRRR